MLRWEPKKSRDIAYLGYNTQGVDVAEIWQEGESWKYGTELSGRCHDSFCSFEEAKQACEALMKGKNV